MDHVSISGICQGFRICYIKLSDSGGRLFLHTMDSIKDLSKSDVSVGSAKGTSKKEGHYWHDQCKTCTFAVPKCNKKRVAGTLQAIGGKMRKLNDPTVQLPAVVGVRFPYRYVAYGNEQMADTLLKCFWLEENKIDGHKFCDISWDDKGNNREITHIYKFKIMPDFQCITNIGQDKATLVNCLKVLLQMEVLKDRNGKLLF